MERRSAIVVAVVLLLGAVAAIQLADPRFGERTPPEVNFSEPPEEVAADAATQFEYVDYAYQTDILHSGQETWNRVGSVKVENSDQEYKSRGPVGNRGSIIYGNNAIAYFRASTNSSWLIMNNHNTIYPALGFTQPFQKQKILTSNTSILGDNESTRVIRINASIQKIVDDFPGETILYVDKNSGLITKATTKYENTNGKISIVRFKLTNRDSTVHRPKASVWELIFDILRGPIMGDY